MRVETRNEAARSIFCSLSSLQFVAQPVPYKLKAVPSPLSLPARAGASVGALRIPFAATGVRVVLEQHHGLTAHAAVLTFGVFQALSYLGALPAGVIADRALSHVTTTLLGCTLLTLGYGALALNLPTLLWPALGLMVCGHGFFKPGINALVSSRSGDDHSQREHAFLMLHVAINIGAMTVCTRARAYCM